MVAGRYLHFKILKFPLTDGWKQCRLPQVTHGQRWRINTGGTHQYKTCIRAASVQDGTVAHSVRSWNGQLHVIATNIQQLPGEAFNGTWMNLALFCAAPALLSSSNSKLKLRDVSRFSRSLCWSPRSLRSMVRSHQIPSPSDRFQAKCSGSGPKRHASSGKMRFMTWGVWYQAAPWPSGSWHVVPCDSTGTYRI